VALSTGSTASVICTSVGVALCSSVTPRSSPRVDARWLLLACLVVGLILIGDGDGDDSNAVRETQGASADFASVPIGERCGMGFTLWPEGPLAVVDKQAVDARQSDLQAVCPQGSGLDARLVPLAETPPLAEGDTAPAGAGEPELGALDGRVVDGEGDSRAQDVAVEVSDYAGRSVSSDTYTRFFEGYREGNGQYTEDTIVAMIQCESSWRIDPGGYHLGLAQFDPGTWAVVSAITGYTDWRDPFSQGYNVAVWASMVSPGTSAGWPYCW